METRSFINTKIISGGTYDTAILSNTLLNVVMLLS